MTNTDIDEFQFGADWREVTITDWFREPESSDTIETTVDGKDRYWVRPARTPPLPTEPGYYVDESDCVWRLSDVGWTNSFGAFVDAPLPAQPLTRYVSYSTTNITAVVDYLKEIGSWTIANKVLNHFGTLEK